MKLDWFADISTDVEAKNERRHQIQSSAKGLALLKVILEKKLAAVRTNQESKDWLDNPNWPYQQADANGSARMLREIIDLLTIESK